MQKLDKENKIDKKLYNMLKKCQHLKQIFFKKFNFFQLKIAVCISDFVILSKSPILVNRFFKIYLEFLKRSVYNKTNCFPTGFMCMFEGRISSR